MKNSKRQIILSKISNSQLSTSDHKQPQNYNSFHGQNHFRNDLKMIQHNESHFSHQKDQNPSSCFEDQDEEIIQSMKQKQRILKVLQVLKSQTKQSNKAKNNKFTTKNNKSSSTQHSQAKINTINSCDKRMALVSSGQKKFSSIKSKPNKTSMFNCSSLKIVGASNSKKHLLHQKHTKNLANKQANSLSSSKINILAPKKLQYNLDMLMKSPNKNYLAKNKRTEQYQRANDYGLPEYSGSHRTELQIRDNTHKIPFRFYC